MFPASPEAWVRLLCSGADLLICSSCFAVAVLQLLFACQNTPQLPDETLKQLPLQAWMVDQKPALETWLQGEQSSQDKSRLHAVGNIVVPAMCDFALQCIRSQS